MKSLWLVAAVACSSEPREPAPTQLSDQAATSLWVVGSTLYFYDGNVDPSIWAMPIDGSAMPQRRFAVGVASLIAFGSDRVYYTTDNGDGSKDVLAEPLGGGSAATLAAGEHVMALARSSLGPVLFDKRVQLLPDGGGSAVDLGSGPYGFAAVAADGAYAYWVEDMPRDCNRVALDGSARLSTMCQANTQIVPHGDVVYTRFNCPQDGACGAISSLDFATDASQTLASPDDIGPIAVDDAHVYWVEPHRVMRAELDGRAQVPLARTTQDDVVPALAVDATSIYFAIAGTTEARGIWSAPK